MSWTVTKDGVSVTADTQAELAIAIAALNTDATVAEPKAIGTVHLPVAAKLDVPPWAVGGPSPNNPVANIFPPVDGDDDPQPVKLGIVRDTESDDSDVKPATVQHIPVSAKLLEVLEAVMLFPEGVGCPGISTLLGLTVKTVTGRMQMLKKQGLVETVPHHRAWRATELARRAKLVKC